MIKKRLQRGIVNSRALTRYIRETEGLDSTADATLVSYAATLSQAENPKRSGASSEIVGYQCETRSGTRKREYHQETMNRIGEFASNPKTVRGEKVKLVAGVRFIRVIADQNALENFCKTVQPTHVIRYSKDHA